MSDDAKDSMRIDEWIQTWGDTMIRLSYLIVKDRELAQDVAQEAFLRLYQRLNERPGEPVSVGWLYAVTKNLARDMRRKTRRLSETFSLSDEDVPVGGFELGVVSRLDVMHIFGRLTARDRECLWLYYFAGLSTKDMAEALHISNDNVRTRLHRARERFLSLWKEDNVHAH